MNTYAHMYANIFVIEFENTYDDYELQYGMMVI